MPSLLPGTKMISDVPPFSLVEWILVMIYRDKTNAVVVPDWSTHTGTCSCYRWPPGPIVILAVTKKCDVATQTSKYHLLCKKKKKKKRKKKKTVLNSNQSNYTRANYLHIASIIMISNNGYLIPKICVMYSVMMY